MSPTSKQLAEQYAQRTQEPMRTAATLSKRQWQAPCVDKGWTVGVTAHHLAATVPLILDSARSIMSGHELPANTVELTNQFNAQHASKHAACTRQETLTLLKQNGELATAFVRGLSEQDLERRAPLAFLSGQEWTTRQWLENILIGHIGMHLPSIQAALSAQGRP
jgi:uncharacterized damage-inducible protein DinB